MPNPIGTVSLWHGAIVDIPFGWLICDGANGTPDMRDKFVIGAGSTYNLNDAGGDMSHIHTFTGNGHTHDPTGLTDVQSGGGAFGYDSGLGSPTSSNAAVGTSDTPDSPPPYYALFFIKRVA